MENKKLNLYEKIQAVSMEVMNIEKDMQVGSGNYAYKAVSDRLVTLHVKKAENKFRVLSIPIKQELTSSEILKTIVNQKEHVKFIDNIKMTVRIIDLDDPKQFIDVESYGKGVDTGDKGLGKASTYARKYALLNAYKIATGEDPDANKNEDIQMPLTVSEKRKVVTDFYSKNIKLIPNLLKHFNVENIDDLSEENIELIYKTYKEKGKF